MLSRVSWSLARLGLAWLLTLLPAFAWAQTADNPTSIANWTDWANAYTSDATTLNLVFTNDITAQSTLGNNNTATNITINGGNFTFYGNNFSPLRFTNNPNVNLSISNLTVTGAGVSGNGGAVYVDTMTGGSISGTYTENLASAYGGAVYVATMNGGSISGTYTGNSALQYEAGAVYVGTLTNGSISGSYSGNTAMLNGGAMLVGAMSGGSISGTYSGNTAQDVGGAVLIRTLTGGSISGTYTENTAQRYGGALAVTSMRMGSISGTYTENTAHDAGGAVFLESLAGGLIGGSYKGNTTQGSGGAVYVVVMNGGSIDGTYLGNTASRYGGAVYVLTMTGGSISGSYFGNTAEQGGAVYVKTMTGGSISGSYFGNTAQSGGAVALETLSGGSISGTYYGNTAQSGGAVAVQVVNNSLINGTYLGNTAQQYGGAVAVGAMVRGSISGTYLGNTAGELGGAWYIGTENVSVECFGSLTAAQGEITLFSGNSDSTGANSIYFGRSSGFVSLADQTLIAQGLGTVVLYDPIGVDLNNGKSFYVNNRMTEGGALIWGGLNVIDLAGASRNAEAWFIFGTNCRTHLTSDYSLSAGGGNMEMALGFGDNHQLSFSGHGRDQNLAFFDFSRANASRIFTKSDDPDLLVEPDSLLAFSGRYLISNDNGEAIQTIITIEPSARWQADWELGNDNELWATASYGDVSELSPNAAAAGTAIDYIYHTSAWGRAVAAAAANGNPAEKYAIMDQLTSLTLKSGMDMPQAAWSAHRAISQAARQLPVWVPQASDTARPWSLGLIPLAWLNRTDGQKNLAGYDADLYGVMLGAGQRFNDLFGLALWLGLSKANTNFDRQVGQADSSGLHAGLAAVLTPGPWRFGLEAAWTKAQVELSRQHLSAGQARADFDQQIWSLEFSAARIFALPNNLGTLTPQLSLTVGQVHQDAIRDRADSSQYAAELEQLKLRSATLEAAVAWSRAWAVGNGLSLAPSLKLGWQHELGDISLTATQRYQAIPELAGLAPIILQSLPRDQNALVAAAALTLSGPSNWTLSATYDLTASPNASYHGIYLSLGFRF